MPGTLEVDGREHLTIYQAMTDDAGGEEAHRSPAQRHFCRLCGSHLWLWDARWPELIHPLASAIDSPLPVPPERTHLMLASKARWVEPAAGPDDRRFEHYPDESIAAWHERLGLVQDD